MSLFKIKRGDSSRLDNQEFHDGYAYLTTDDGGFYIDAVDGNNTNKRIHINPDYSGDISNHVSNKSNPHEVTKAQVGLGNVPNVATNDQTPTFTQASSVANLTSGEKLSVMLGKISKAIASLISHTGNTSNPHGVTAAQVGAVPTSRTVNGKALSANISLTASDVGLGNVDNKSSATIRGELTKKNVTDALGYTPPETDTTYSVMGAATASAAGTSGLVPAPSAGDQGKVLTGGGKWTDIPTLSKTDSGNGNAITGITVSGHGITVTKGTTFLTSHQDISGKADKSATVSTVAYDTTNKKITKTINGTTSDVVTVAKLKTDMALSKSDVGLGNVDNTADANKSVSSATTASTANKTVGKLTIAGKEFDGSDDVSVTLADLGLTGSMILRGTSTTALTDGATTSPITLSGGTSLTPKSGDAVLYGEFEFVWTGSAWERLGGDGSYVLTTDTRLTDSRTPKSHTHGNVTNDGKLSTASRIVVTDSSKNITVGSIDPSNLVVTTDTRLSDARTPTSHTHTKSEITDFPTTMTPASHTHGNITNAGALGTASRIVVTDSNKKITTGSIDPANLVVTTDSRLSDARTPTSHEHGNITNDGKVGSTSGYAVYTTTGGTVTAGTLATSDPTADGTSTTFIKTASQDAKGKMTLTKASLPTASTTVAGITTVGASGGAAAYSHGNHVPATQTADNAKFLRNDNTWQTVTPVNIGAATSGHNHDSTYLKLSGGTLTGALTAYAGTDIFTDPSLYIGSTGKIGGSSAGIGIYTYGQSVYIRPNATTNSSGSDGLVIESASIHTTNATTTLGSSTNPWANAYLTQINGYDAGSSLQGVSTTSSYRSLLMGSDTLSSATATAVATTGKAYKGTGISACPSTGDLRVGSLTLPVGSSAYSDAKILLGDVGRIGVTSSSNALGLYTKGTTIVARPGSDGSASTKGLIITTTSVYTSDSNTTLGTTDNYWPNAYLTKINGMAVGSSPKFTDTTYESKAAASGGTAVSLVTTGEKYTWNNKTSNTGTVTSITLKAGTGVSLDTDDTAITTSGTRTISLAGGVVTAGSAGPTAAVSGSNNATIAVPRITVDEYGRVTGLTSYTLTCKNTTYSSIVESSGGTSTSLCTNGEKYTWNHKAEVPKIVTVTLSSSGWSNLSQTVTCTGVLASETAQEIIINPANASKSEYYARGILVTAQDANSLTFTAKSAPSSNLTVYVTLMTVSA